LQHTNGDTSINMDGATPRQMGAVELEDTDIEYTTPVGLLKKKSVMPAPVIDIESSKSEDEESESEVEEKLKAIEKRRNNLKGHPVPDSATESVVRDH
jgi:hypothetical protein